MTTIEQEISLTPQQKAADMADHWQKFVAGRETRFFAYFMLEDEHHEEIRQIFLEKVGATDELPYPESQSVLKCGRAILNAASNCFENGDPYDVLYTGSQLDPIQ